MAINPQQQLNAIKAEALTVVDAQNNTKLNMACQNGNLDQLAIYCKALGPAAAAALNQKNRSGFNALDMARLYFGNDLKKQEVSANMVCLIQLYGGKPGNPTVTAINAAAENAESRKALMRLKM